MTRRAPARDDDLSSKSGVNKRLLELYPEIEKGFEDQEERSNDILDNWDMYDCKINQKQFYAGTSKIYMPFVRDAVDARVTRFTNQLFPQTGRYVEVTTAEADPPQATQALLEGYVRKTKLRTQIVPALLRNGDVEGQYTLYAGWREQVRHVVSRQMVQPETDGLPNEAAEPVEDFDEEEVIDAFPEVEVIADPDLLIRPVRADSVEDALEMGGDVTVLRRWTKAKIRKLIKDGDILKTEGEALLKDMSKVRDDEKADVGKKLADAAGIKGKGKFALVYETWTRLKVDGEEMLCRAYFGGATQILGCKQNPFWSDRCPVLSVPVKKLANSVKGQAPVKSVADLQIFANDTINEGADTAHFSAMPIVMTDPLTNPRVDTMVLGLAAVWETAPSSTQIVQFPDLWRSCLDRSEAIKQQIFQSLGVNPAMVPQQTGGPAKKRTQAEIANEQQVDLLTTADMVTIIEEGILTPLMQRFAEYDHQYRDRATTIRVYGEMGERANMEEIEPIQLGKRFEFRWYGVEAARNAAQMQQQISWVNVVKGLPPESYPDYVLDISPMIVAGTENVFGPRLGPLIFKRKSILTVDPNTENEMMLHGFPVMTHPGDNDQEHLQVHQQALAAGDPHNTIRQHMSAHQQQMQAKAAAQAMQQPQGGPPGGGQGPRSGAQVAPPRQGKQPPGAIAPDSMPQAGATPMPRKFA